MNKEIDFLDYKIGDEDPNGEVITSIYSVSEKYFLYEIKKNGLVNRIIKEELCDAKKINEISSLLAQFITYLTSRRRRRNNAQIIANAIGNSLDNNVAYSIKFLHDQIAIKEKEGQTNNRLSYLLACLIIVIINALISLVINAMEFDDEIYKQACYLFTIATFGSFGGFISVFLKVNKFDVEIFNNFNLQIWIGISRIFLAMISSLIVFALIKSNVVFGFISDLGNKYIYYSMASLSGFSEYFIPNMLTSLGNKKPD
jgi:hypothetical protein